MSESSQILSACKIKCSPLKWCLAAFISFSRTYSDKTQWMSRRCQHVATLVSYSISLTCFKQPPQGTSCPGPSLHGHNALRQAHQGSRRHITQTKSPWPHHHSSIPSIRRINELERISMLPCSSYGRKIKTIITRCHEKQFLPSHPNGLMVTP